MLRPTLLHVLGIADLCSDSSPPIPALPSLKHQESMTFTFGLSAGASMAVQYHVAFSNSTQGAAIFAGKPYWCEQGATRSVSHGKSDDCLRNPEKVRVTELIDYARANSGSGIDAVNHLETARVFVYHGKNDHTYLNGSMLNTAAFYEHFVTKGKVTRQINIVDSDHAIPTDDFGSRCGGGQSEDGCEKCAYDGAGKAFETLFSRPLQPPDPDYNESLLFPFDQRPFQRAAREPATWRNGLTTSGLLFVPPACTAAGSEQACHLVVLFHGCGGTCDIPYVKKNGVLKWASTNRIVVLAPQVGDEYIGAGNASGSVQTCFDNYGDTGSDYCLKQGTQMQSVKAMVDALRGGVGSTA